MTVHEKDILALKHSIQLEKLVKRIEALERKVKELDERTRGEVVFG